MAEEFSDQTGAVVLDVRSKLDMLRVKARENTDARSYRRLCDQLDVEPEDQLLYEQGLAEEMIESGELSITKEGPLEAAVNEDPANDTARLRRSSIPTLWGIRRKADLGSLKYMTLDNIWRGMNNVSVPIAMLDILNPDEVLAKWYGAGLMKKESDDAAATFDADFDTCYVLLDRLAYAEPDFRRMSQNCNRRFPSIPGGQRDRLATLDDDVRESFVSSLRSKYVPSQSEEPENHRAYFAPNRDGSSKGAYVREIYRKLQRVWEQAAQSSQ